MPITVKHRPSPGVIGRAGYQSAAQLSAAQDRVRRDEQNRQDRRMMVQLAAQQTARRESAAVNLQAQREATVARQQSQMAEMAMRQRQGAQQQADRRELLGIEYQSRRDLWEDQNKAGQEASAQARMWGWGEDQLSRVDGLVDGTLKKFTDAEWNDGGVAWAALQSKLAGIEALGAPPEQKREAKEQWLKQVQEQGIERKVKKQPTAEEDWQSGTFVDPETGQRVQRIIRSGTPQFGIIEDKAAGFRLDQENAKASQLDKLQNLQLKVEANLETRRQNKWTREEARIKAKNEAARNVVGGKVLGGESEEPPAEPAEVTNEEVAAQMARLAQLGSTDRLSVEGEGGELPQVTTEELAANLQKMEPGQTAKIEIGGVIKEITKQEDGSFVDETGAPWTPDQSATLSRFGDESGIVPIPLHQGPVGEGVVPIPLHQGSAGEGIAPIPLYQGPVWN